MRPAYRGGLEDAQVDGLFDGAEPVAADRLGIGEVKPQAIGLDLAPGLLGVLAQDRAQGVVQEMRGRVGAPDRAAAVGVDPGADRLVDRDFTARHVADVQDEVVFLLAVDHLELKLVAADHARVADLAARLAIERGSIEDEDQRASTVGLGLLGEPVLFEDGDDACIVLGCRVAEELAAVMVFPLERIERSDGEHVGGLGRAARDVRVPAALDLEARTYRCAGCDRSPGFPRLRPGCRTSRAG